MLSLAAIDVVCKHNNHPINVLVVRCGLDETLAFIFRQMVRADGRDESPTK